MPIIFVSGRIVATAEGTDPDAPEHRPGQHGDPRPPTGFMDRRTRQAWFLDRHDGRDVPDFGGVKALAVVPEFIVEDPWTLTCCGYADLHVQTDDWSTLVIGIGQDHALTLDVHPWESEETRKVAVGHETMVEGERRFRPVEFSWTNPDSGVRYRYSGSIGYEVEWWNPDDLHRISQGDNVYELGGEIEDPLYFDWVQQGESARFG